jgi:hypothetical protein
MGAHGQAAALLARDPATHVDLSDSFAAAMVLDLLRKTGEDGQEAPLSPRVPLAQASQIRFASCHTACDSRVCGACYSLSPGMPGL